MSHWEAIGAMRKAAALKARIEPTRLAAFEAHFDKYHKKHPDKTYIQNLEDAVESWVSTKSRIDPKRVAAFGAFSDKYHKEHPNKTYTQNLEAATVIWISNKAVKKTVKEAVLVWEKRALLGTPLYPV